MKTSDYNRNVFINCPFDEDYAPLFDAILFAVYKSGFRPRCAKEADDAGEVRIEKIRRIIGECCFGIHDISRTQLDEGSGLPRFNMPLELGLFLGAKLFGGSRQKTKISMIFDITQYRYQQFLSDIAGQDITAHNNQPESVIRAVRNALNTSALTDNLPGARAIIESYHLFQDNLPRLREELNLAEDDVTYADQTQLIELWLEIAG